MGLGLGWKAALRWAAVWLALAPGPVLAAYSCSLVVQRVNLIARTAIATTANLTNQSLLGLSYSLQVSPTSGTGQGNTGTGAPGNEGQQPVTIQLTVPGGQAGTCSTGSCSASATHTLVVTY